MLEASSRIRSHQTPWRRNWAGTDVRSVEAVLLVVPATQLYLVHSLSLVRFTHPGPLFRTFRTFRERSLECPPTGDTAKDGYL